MRCQARLTCSSNIPDLQLNLYSKEVAALDDPLYYLERNVDAAVFDFVMVQREGNKAVLLFREVTLAEQHLAHLPREVSVHMLDDARSKEEFLRAALQQGVTQLWFDVEVGSLEPQRTQPLAEALFYILSFKREAACL